MDLNKNVRLSENELGEAALNGATVFGPDDERIGHVSKVVGNGPDTEIEIEVGGFLGLGARTVRVFARDLDFVRDQSNSIHAVTDWTKEELQEMSQ